MSEALDRLLAENPGVAQADVAGLRDFFTGSYPRDDRTVEVVLGSTSEFDAVRQKTAVTTTVFEMNHATGQGRKLKRTKFRKDA